MVDEARAAVALLVTTDTILLIRRAHRPGDAWSGHWALPGGRIDAGETAEIAARREVAEEVGIDLGERPPDVVLPPRLAGRHVGKAVPVAPFLWHLEQELPTVPEPAEVAATLWCPVADLADRERHALACLAPAAPDQLMPYVPVQDVPLWGFTYQVLTAWLGIQPPKV